MDHLEFITDITGHKGRFTANYVGKEAGFMTFTMAGDDKLIIDHTEVHEAFNGMGVGKKLVEFAVNHARNKNIKVIPLCPYAKTVFARNPSFADVLAY